MADQNNNHALRITQNNKHSSKVSWYRKNAIDMVNAVDDYLLAQDITLPRYWQEFKARRDEIMKYEDYGTEMDDEYGQLIKMRYDFLKSGKAVYALFDQKGNAPKTQILACWYSKHRLDPVWNYRKSQLIRKIYTDYLKKSNIHNEYHPAHLVLTVPHADGLFRNQRFYAKEIMQCFNQMRKSDTWKKYIYGGEYGVEIKKGRGGNGLHIHIHSLVFQKPEYTINETRDAILKMWQSITGASFIHYETLYFFKKKENGKFETELKSVFDKELNDYKNITVKKKFYIDRYDRPTDNAARISEYIYGVMECIKYHFKNDALQLQDKTYDVDLMVDILNNTKGVRLYSRFGALYKEQELNFNRLEVEHDEQTETQTEEEIMATTDGVESSLINPHTLQPAKEGEYSFIVGRPEWVKHRTKNDAKPYEAVIYSSKVFLKIHEGFALKTVLKKLFKCQLQDILTGESYEKFQRERLTPETIRGRQLNQNLN